MTSRVIVLYCITSFGVHVNGCLFFGMFMKPTDSWHHPGYETFTARQGNPVFCFGMVPVSDAGVSLEAQLGQILLPA